MENIGRNLNITLIMILLIIHFLKEHAGIKAPAVFSYFSTRMMLAALTSCF